MKTKAFAITLLVSFCAAWNISAQSGTTLELNLSDAIFGIGAISNRTINITPYSFPSATSSSVVIGNTVQVTTDANGDAIFLTNIATGLYLFTVLAPPSQSRFAVGVLTNGQGLINASSNLVAVPTATYPAGTVAWSAASSDLRYARSTNGGQVGNLVAAGLDIQTITNGMQVTVARSTNIATLNGTNVFGGPSDNFLGALLNNGVSVLTNAAAFQPSSATLTNLSTVPTNQLAFANQLTNPVAGLDLVGTLSGQNLTIARGPNISTLNGTNYFTGPSNMFTGPIYVNGIAVLTNAAAGGQNVAAGLDITTSTNSTIITVNRGTNVMTGTGTNQFTGTNTFKTNVLMAGPLTVTNNVVPQQIGNSHLAGTDAAGNLTNIVVGSGLSLSGGTLMAPGGSLPAGFTNLFPNPNQFSVDSNTNLTIISGATVTNTVIENNANIGDSGSLTGNGSSPVAVDSSILGGFGNSMGGNGNGIQFPQWSSISGGYSNVVSGGAQYSFIGGGQFNNIAFQDIGSAILGGINNDIMPFGLGVGNVVVGGRDNYLTNVNGGGDGYNFIGGGRSNRVMAGAIKGVIAGGFNNLVGGNYSQAGGYGAQATNTGTYVWSDASVNFGVFNSVLPDTYLVQASNGVAINTNNPHGNALAVNGSVSVATNLTVSGSLTNNGAAYFNGALNLGSGTESIAGLVTAGNQLATNAGLYVSPSGFYSPVPFTGSGAGLTSIPNGALSTSYAQTANNGSDFASTSATLANLHGIPSTAGGAGTNTILFGSTGVTSLTLSQPDNTSSAFVMTNGIAVFGDPALMGVNVAGGATPNYEMYVNTAPSYRGTNVVGSSLEQGLVVASGDRTQGTYENFAVGETNSGSSVSKISNPVNAQFGATGDAYNTRVFVGLGIVGGVDLANITNQDLDHVLIMAVNNPFDIGWSTTSHGTGVYTPLYWSDQAHQAEAAGVLHVGLINSLAPTPKNLNWQDTASFNEVTGECDFTNGAMRQKGGNFYAEGAQARIGPGDDVFISSANQVFIGESGGTANNAAISGSSLSFNSNGTLGAPQFLNRTSSLFQYLNFGSDGSLQIGRYNNGTLGDVNLDFIGGSGFRYGWIQHGTMIGGTNLLATNSMLEVTGGFIQADSGILVNGGGTTNNGTGFYGNGVGLTNLNLGGDIAPVTFTNFVVNTLYTNTTGGTLLLHASVSLTTAAVTGVSEMDLFCLNNGATAATLLDVASTPTAATLVLGNPKYGLNGSVTNNGCYYYSNTSTGSGNSSALISGTGQTTGL